MFVPLWPLWLFIPHIFDFKKFALQPRGIFAKVGNTGPNGDNVRYSTLAKLIMYSQLYKHRNGKIETNLYEKNCRLVYDNLWSKVFFLNTTATELPALEWIHYKESKKVKYVSVCSTLTLNCDSLVKGGRKIAEGQ